MISITTLSDECRVSGCHNRHLRGPGQPCVAHLFNARRAGCCERRHDPPHDDETPRVPRKHDRIGRDCGCGARLAWSVRDKRWLVV